MQVSCSLPSVCSAGYRRVFLCFKNPSSDISTRCQSRRVFLPWLLVLECRRRFYPSNTLLHHRPLFALPPRKHSEFKCSFSYCSVLLLSARVMSLCRRWYHWIASSVIPSFPTKGSVKSCFCLDSMTCPLALHQLPEMPTSFTLHHCDRQPAL